MKGDFSWDTFDKTKHFSRVLMQQGRVQLDADWNEQSAILLHYLRTLAADLIGPFAGPAGADGFPHGFLITPMTSDFSISAGRYYVDGILCENDKEDLTYTSQEDYPTLIELDKAHSYLVYLDVWEHHITAIEDDSIREKALGGPDTASRAKVVWQVKIEDVTSEVNLPSDLEPVAVQSGWGGWVDLLQPPHLGCLKARVKPPEKANDPCLTAPDAKYRGQENQLYRVEIHTGGQAESATFKWSRDNGAIVTGCELKGTELTVLNPRGFAANRWVELTNDEQDLRGEPGTLVKVTKVEGDVLTLEHTVLSLTDVPPDEEWPTKVRRWDQSEKGNVKLDGGAVPVKEGANETDWIELEDGIQIQFQTDNQNLYRTGDYWLIPARVATGNIEWPQETDAQGKAPTAKPPNGIRHHYAPLAILTSADGIWGSTDCRCDFTAMNSCDIESHGEDGMGSAPSCESSD